MSARKVEQIPGIDPEEISSKTELFKQGGYITEVIVVLNGVVKLARQKDPDELCLSKYYKTHFFRMVNAPSIFGNVDFAQSPQYYKASAASLTPLVIQRIPVEKLPDMLDNPIAFKTISSALVTQRRDSYDQMRVRRRIGADSVDHIIRLYTALRREYSQFPKFIQKELAIYAGVSRETTNKRLRLLRETNDPLWQGFAAA